MGPGEPYDPFEAGGLPIAATSLQLTDTARDRVFPAEVWYPALGEPATYPLVMYSHSGGGTRRSATFLTTHLASHGYVVAAVDHSEIVAAELKPREGETADERATRVDAAIGSRVPDIRFLLDSLLDGAAWKSTAAIDPDRVGIVGHSFGGWTALAAPETEPRIRAVVALAPGGSRLRRPGILPATAEFRWDREIPTLYLVADRDTPVPLDGMYELFGRTPEPRRMVILHRADHQHFLDDVEEMHEAVRAMAFPGEASWIPEQTPPMSELCSIAEAHLFTRGLTLSHFDAFLKQDPRAAEMLASGIDAALAARGVTGTAYEP